MTLQLAIGVSAALWTCVCILARQHLDGRFAAPDEDDDPREAM